MPHRIHRVHPEQLLDASEVRGLLGRDHTAWPPPLRLVEGQPVWSTRDVLDHLASLRRQPIPVTGSPIPGFPGYTLDRKEDGTWGIRMWTPRGGTVGRFKIPAGRPGGPPYFQLRAEGGAIETAPIKAWVEYVHTGQMPPKGVGGNPRFNRTDLVKLFESHFEHGENALQIAERLDLPYSVVKQALRGTTYVKEAADLREQYKSAKRPSARWARRPTDHPVHARR